MGEPHRARAAWPSAAPLFDWSTHFTDCQTTTLRSAAERSLTVGFVRELPRLAARKPLRREEASSLSARCGRNATSRSRRTWNAKSAGMILPLLALGLQAPEQQFPKEV
jgi:hypothetical protein